MKKLLFLFVLSSLFFVACKNEVVSSKDAAINSVPADVSSVSSINIKQLMDKADFDNIIIVKDVHEVTKLLKPEIKKFYIEKFKS